MKRLCIITLFFAAIGLELLAQPKQFLYIKFAPSDATIEINGVVKATQDGVYQELLTFGEYEYRLHRDGYTDVCGTITISDPNNTHIMDLKLKRPYALLSILTQTNVTGGSVYIDDECIGELPIQKCEIASGFHRLTIEHPLYNFYNTTLNISDEENKSVAVSLIKSHVIVNLQTSEGTDIYVNDEYKGRESWSGALAIDSTYRFESHKPGHSSSEVEHKISISDHEKTITIPAPIPIYGSVNLTSTLPKARIYIDDNFVGETPIQIDKVLMGEHSIFVRYKDYKSPVQTLTLAENEEKELFLNIPHGTLAIMSNPPEAKIYLDGEMIGKSPKYIPAISLGEHIVKLEYNDDILQTQSIVVCIEDEKHTDVSLQKTCGSLSITSNPSNASVYIDSLYIGESPCQIAEIMDGEHHVKVVYANGEEQQQVVNVTHGECTKVEFKTPCGSLCISSIPANAKIFINGERSGETPKYISEMKEGDYTISIEYPDCSTETRTVTIVSNKQTEVEFIMPVAPAEENSSEQPEHENQNTIDTSQDVKEDNPATAQEEHISYLLIKEKPTFMGNNIAMFTKWVAQRLVYPKNAKLNHIQGRIILQFTIDTDGSLTDIVVLRKLDPELEAEAVRVVSMSPKWKPGYLNGHPVPVHCTFPIDFTL